MSKRILIATGGTGGHIFPAEALAKDLVNDGNQVFFAGGKLSQNRFFSKKYPFEDVTVGMSPLKDFKLILRGIQESFDLFKQLHPDVVVGFGSYYSFPVLAAAILKRIPVVLYAADTKPGKVIRWLHPFAKACGLHFEGTPLKGEVVGMPLRFNPKYVTKDEAMKYYKLDKTKPVCLVFGGSQGAKYLNTLAFDALKNLPFQVIHFTGNQEDTSLLAMEYNKRGIKAVVKTFESRMEYAWAASDIALTRAGAVSLAEEMAFKVPGVLVPFPFAMDDHQTKNAEVLVKMGFCEMRQEKELTPELLEKLLKEVWKTREERIKKLDVHKTPYTLKDLVIKSI